VSAAFPDDAEAIADIGPSRWDAADPDASRAPVVANRKRGSPWPSAQTRTSDEGNGPGSSASERVAMSPRPPPSKARQSCSSATSSRSSFVALLLSGLRRRCPWSLVCTPGWKVQAVVAVT